MTPKNKKPSSESVYQEVVRLPSSSFFSSKASTKSTGNPAFFGAESKIVSKNREELKKKADEVMKQSVMKQGFEKQQNVQPVQETRKQLKQQRKVERDKTKGKDWFDLPATEMTDETKRDLEIIQMRDSLDPKRFYKSNDRNVLPKYFQVGTVVDQAIDFYTSRVPKKERKKTLVDELLADDNFQRQNKRKYSEIEEKHHRSRKGAFRNKGFPKKKKRKTEL